MRKLKLGMIGGGFGAFIGDTHRRAARISNDYELLGGVFSSDFKKSKAFGVAENLDPHRIYADVESFIKGEKSLPKDKQIEVVAIVTPNSFHYEQAKVLLENGFHVICDKPVTISVHEAEELQRLVQASGLVFCLTHTYTGYPMVRQIREFVKQGMLGDIQRVDVQYYQGWVNPMIHGKSSDLSAWRLDPKVAGISSCMADIGVHAFNLIEYTTGLQVDRVLADLNTVSENVELDLYGTVLLRFKENLRGVVRSSQVANGEENGISLAIYGSKASLLWEQENPNLLRKIAHDEPEIVYKPGNSYNTKFAEASHTMPFGHPEGIYEAFANLYHGAAKAIRGEALYDGEYPGIEDGVRGMKFIHQAVASNKEGNIWKNL